MAPELVPDWHQSCADRSFATALLDLVLIAVLTLVRDGSGYAWMFLVFGWQALFFAFAAGFAFNNRLRQQGRLVGGFRNSFSVYEPSPGHSDDE